MAEPLSADDSVPQRRSSAMRRGPASEKKILAAAKELFLSDRYDGVNLERVADRAGVSRQTVYNRFGSKEAVFRAMLDYHWSAFADPDRHVVDTNVDTDADADADADADTNADTSADTSPATSAEQTLFTFARALQRFATETDQIRFARLVVAESVRLPWIADEFFRRDKKPIVAAFVERLDALVRDGALRCPDTYLAARQFMGLIQEFLVWPRVMAFDEESAAGPTPEVVIEQAVRMFLASYAPASNDSTRAG